MVSASLHLYDQRTDPLCWGDRPVLPTSAPTSCVQALSGTCASDATGCGSGEWVATTGLTAKLLLLIFVIYQN